MRNTLGVKWSHVKRSKIEIHDNCGKRNLITVAGFHWFYHWQGAAQGVSRRKGRGEKGEG
jgi:hypothetical protein